MIRCAAFFCVLLLVLCLSPGGTIAQGCLDFGPGPLHLGTYPGTGMSCAAAQGNLICVGTSTGALIVVDATDPAAPTWLGELALGGADLAHIEWVGDLAYVAAGSAGLLIVDLMNPAAPALLGTLDTAGNAADVSVMGSHAYVADQAGGLVIADVADPAAPVQVANLETENSVDSVASSGEFLLCSGSQDSDWSYEYTEGFTRSLEVAHPAAPTVVGEFLSGQVIDQMCSLGGAVFMSVSSSWRSGPNFWDPRHFNYSVVRLDLEPSGALSLAAERDLGERTALDHISLAGTGDRIVMGRSTGAVVLTAATLERVGEIPATSGAPLCRNNEIVLPNPETGLEFFDLAQYGDAPLFQNQLLPIQQVGGNLCSSDGYVVRLGEQPPQIDGPDDGSAIIIQVLGVDSGGGLEQLWQDGWSLSPGPVPSAVCTWDQFVYICTGATLETCSVAGGQPVDQVSNLENSYDQMVVADGLLAGSSYYLLDIFSLADPADPVLLHSLDVGRSERVKDIQGSLVYTSDSNLLRAYDASLATPVANTTTLSGDIRDFDAVDGFGYALVATAAGDVLYTLTLDDPLAPVTIASLPLPGICNSLQVSDGVAYLGSLDLGVVAISVSSPASPSLLGSEYFNNLLDVTASSAGVFTMTEDWTYRMPLSCQSTVAAYLSTLEAAPVSDKVILTWHTTGDADAMRFRVDAATQGATWTVPCIVNGAGFLARDCEAVLHAPCRIDYTLNFETDGQWRVMARRSVDLVAPARVTRLLAPHPNPFNPTVEIAYETAQPGRVQVQVFDVAGRHIADLVDEHQEFGSHSTRWNGCDDLNRPVPAGTYFARLTSGQAISTQKLLLLK